MSQSNDPNDPSYWTEERLRRWDRLIEIVENDPGPAPTREALRRPAMRREIEREMDREPDTAEE